MSVLTRLARIEKAAGGRCPDCPPVAVLDAGWYGTEAAGDVPAPPPCATCGRPADFVRVVEDPHFFRRLDPCALQHAWPGWSGS